MSHTEASTARQRRPSKLSLHHVSQPNRPFNPDREQIWNPHYQDPVLGALRGSDVEVDQYLASVTTCSDWSRQDGGSGCIDPHLLQPGAVGTGSVLLPSPLLGVRLSSPKPETALPIPGDASPVDDSRKVQSLPPTCPSMPVSSLSFHTPLSLQSQSTSASPAETSGYVVNSPPTPITDTESHTAADPSGPVSLDINNHQPAGRKGFPCQVPGCPFARPFSSERDLDRHCNSKHDGAGGRAFRCRCGKLDTRKDNHDRHFPVCRKDVKTSYRCWCEHETALVTEHQEHIRHWTMKSGCP